jgi:ribonuclease HI
MENVLTIHTDGGARGNPGPAAIGVVIKKNGKALKEFGKRIGETTNNVAEYAAVVEALHCCKSNNYQPKSINFFLDSLLVVNQLMGKFKVKDSKLRLFLLEVRSLEQEVGGVITYTTIPREKNMRADFFVNQALDN